MPSVLTLVMIMPVRPTAITLLFITMSTGVLVRAFILLEVRLAESILFLMMRQASSRASRLWPLGSSRVLMAFLGRVVKVLLAGVNIAIDTLPPSRVLASLVVLRVVANILKPLLSVVSLVTATDAALIVLVVLVLGTLFVVLGLTTLALVVLTLTLVGVTILTLVLRAPILMVLALTLMGATVLEPVRRLIPEL